MREERGWRAEAALGALGRLLPLSNSSPRVSDRRPDKHPARRDQEGSEPGKAPPSGALVRSPPLHASSKDAKRRAESKAARRLRGLTDLLRPGPHNGRLLFPRSGLPCPYFASLFSRGLFPPDDKPTISRRFGEEKERPTTAVDRMQSSPKVHAPPPPPSRICSSF